MYKYPINKTIKESLVELKKQRLLAELNAFESNIAGPSTSSAPIRIDSEDDTDIVGNRVFNSKMFTISETGQHLRL